MAVWHLHRDTFTDQGVWGKLEGGGGWAFETIENPDTLIPAGEWVCIRDVYYGGDGVGGKADYPCFRIVIPNWDPDGDGVPNKNQHKFHAANYAEELEGCIAPGMERGYTLGVPGVFRSREAFNLFMDANKEIDLFTLVITEANNID